MRIYLSHPTSLREEIRKWELKVREKLGIEFINPFHNLSIGAKTKSVRVVKVEIEAINQADIFLAAVPSPVITVGVWMEMFYASWILRKKTIAWVHEELKDHPWIMHLATKIFVNEADLFNYLAGLK